MMKEGNNGEMEGKEVKGITLINERKKERKREKEKYLMY